MKDVGELTVEDLLAHPVWQFTNNEDTTVRPVKRIPVASLAGRILGTEVVLANRTKVWASFGNIAEHSPQRTAHFLAASFERDGRWFHLARYHDVDYEKRGPEQLAAFLGLPVDDVFPISYDVRKFAKGDPLALCGVIPKEPQERLTEDELIALAIG